MERPEVLTYNRNARIFGTEESHQALEDIYDKAYDRYQSCIHEGHDRALIMAYIWLASNMEAYINAKAEGMKV